MANLYGHKRSPESSNWAEMLQSMYTVRMAFKVDSNRISSERYRQHAYREINSQLLTSKFDSMNSDVFDRHHINQDQQTKDVLAVVIYSKLVLLQNHDT